MRLPAVALIFAIVAGCSGSHTEQIKTMLNGYIAHPVSDVARRFGPPASSSDAGDGKTTFQWMLYGIGQPSGFASSGGSLLYSASQAYQTECRLLIIAAPSVENAPPTELENWIVQGWQANGNGCM